MRIPEKLLERIDEKCNNGNCSRNDYIISILEESINENSNQEIKSKPIKHDYTVKWNDGSTNKGHVIIDYDTNSITGFDGNGKQVYKKPCDERFPIREPIPKAEIVRIIK